MVLRKIMGLFVCALVIGSAAFATAGIPDPDQTVAVMSGVTGQTVVLFNLPNGGGSPFTDAQIKDDGTAIDATITMTVMDQFGAVIADFPSEDMWLESGDNGMVPCVGGANADFSTDVNGVTSWATPLNAGGSSEADTYVMVNGESLNGVPFGLNFNSADMNGDGTVNLADVGLFSNVFFGAYSFSGDFYADGVMNLVDVGRLATGLGGSCP